MKKEQLSSFVDKEVIYNGEGSTIYRLPDKRVLKVASPLVFKTCDMVGTSYESKILSTAARSVKEIVCPLTAVYNGSKCIGYTMEEINGVDLNNYDANYSLFERADLNKYALLYSKIEQVVKKANKVGIVMPDLCTCDNIIILPNGNLKFIDFDGMQFGSKDKSIALSTSLGNPINYIYSKKYSNSFFSFSKELDKTSLTILMFLVVFNINLTKIGQVNPFTGKVVTFNEIFQLLGIEDEVFMNKVALNLSSDKAGVYLEDELFKIARNYDMCVAKLPNMKDSYMKKLIKK